MKQFLHRWYGYLTIVVIAAVVGALGRAFLPPFVLDDPFWLCQPE